MILFLNVLVTDENLTFFERGRFGPAPDRLAVFKYSLLSLSVIPWTKVVIYCELDEPYLSRWAELRNFIAQHYPNAELYPFRNLYQAEWQKAIRPLLDGDPTEAIWYFCNDDHIFLEPDLTLFNEAEARMRSLMQEHRYVTLNPTHFTENLAFLDPNFEQNYFNGSRHYGPLRSELLAVEEKWFINKWYFFSAAQAVNKALLEYWWFSHPYGDQRFPRTDFGPGVMSPPDVVTINPLREMVRHFDGYAHASVDINIVSPLNIPRGLFENELKIQFAGAGRNADTAILVDPERQNYTCVDANGADFRGMIEDLPLVWRRASCEVVDCSTSPRSKLLRARNTAVLRTAMAKARLPFKQMLGLLKVALRTEGLPDTIPAAEEVLSGLPTRCPSVLRRKTLGETELSIFVPQMPWDAQLTWEPEVLAATELRALPIERLLGGYVKSGSVPSGYRVFDQIVMSPQPENVTRGTYDLLSALRTIAIEARGDRLVYFSPGFLPDASALRTALIEILRESELSSNSITRLIASISEKDGETKQILCGCVVPRTMLTALSETAARSNYLGLWGRASSIVECMGTGSHVKDLIIPYSMREALTQALQREEDLRQVSTLIQPFITLRASRPGVNALDEVVEEVLHQMVKADGIVSSTMEANLFSVLGQKSGNLLMEALQAIGAGELHAARTLVLQAFEHDSNSSAAQCLSAYLDGMAGETATAVLRLEKVLQAEPTHFYARYGRLLFNSPEENGVSPEMLFLQTLYPSSPLLP